MTGTRENESPAADDDANAFALRRRKWPWLVLLAVLVSGAGAAVVFMPTAVNATKVLVAVDVDGYWWQGSEASATITDVFGTRLAALGLEVVKAGDPEVMRVLEQAESPEAAAKALGAGFVVHAELKPDIIEYDITPKYYESRVAGSVSLQFVGEAPQVLGQVDGWSGSLEQGKSKALLGKVVADKVFDVGIVALMQHHAVQKILSAGSAVDRGMLTKATRFLEIREAALAAAHQAYEQLLEKRLAGEEGQHDQQYHGKFDESVALAAVTPMGALVQTSRIRPFYDPVSERLGYYRDLDGLFLAPDTGERKELFRAYNLYGYPAASLDGKTVIFVEDIFGWAKAISVVRDGSKAERLRVDPDHRYSSPQVSPDGRFAAFFDRPCRKCLNGVLVIELGKGTTAFERQEREGEPAGFAWVGVDQLLLLWRPVPTEQQQAATTQGVYRVDLAASKPELQPLLQLDAVTSLGSGSSNAAGTLVAFTRSHDDGRHLAILDVEKSELSFHDVGGGLTNPVLARVGSGVAFEQDGEIMHYDFQTSTKTQLTNNNVRDRYPLFSPDGTRIYYESLGDDPNFPRERNASVVASVKTP